MTTTATCAARCKININSAGEINKDKTRLYCLLQPCLLVFVAPSPTHHQQVSQENKTRSIHVSSGRMSRSQRAQSQPFAMEKSAKGRVTFLFPLVRYTLHYIDAIHMSHSRTGISFSTCAQCSTCPEKYATSMVSSFRCIHAHFQCASISGGRSN